MYSVVTDQELVEMYQKIFVNNLYHSLPDTYTKNIGFQGASRTEDIHHSSELNIWFTTSTDLEEANRYWNPIGIQDPNKFSNLNIAVEINFPFELNRRVAGVFVKDDSGNVYVGHRGNISGGRKGVSKSLFMKQFELRYSNKLVEVFDGDKVNTVVIIDALDSPNLAKSIKWFAYEIFSIKETR